MEVCCGSACPGEMGAHLPDRNANFPVQEKQPNRLGIFVVCAPIPITGHTSSVVEKVFLLYSNIEYSHLFEEIEVSGICLSSCSGDAGSLH